MSARFTLPPEVFDALHLSALAHGGIGRNAWVAKDGPLCIRGHAATLDRDNVGYPCLAELTLAGITTKTNDDALRNAGVACSGERVPFEYWCELVGVDVAGAPHAG